MSYDVSLVIDTGGPEPAEVGGWINITSNLADMFESALGPGGVKSLNNKLAGDVIPQLKAGVTHITDPENEATYKAMNPSNGWGDHSGAIEFLREVLEMCERHPKSTVVVSW